MPNPHATPQKAWMKLTHAYPPHLRTHHGNVNELTYADPPHLRTHHGNNVNEVFKKKGLKIHQFSQHFQCFTMCICMEENA